MMAILLRMWPSGSQTLAADGVQILRDSLSSIPSATVHLKGSQLRSQIAFAWVRRELLPERVIAIHLGNLILAEVAGILRSLGNIKTVT
jgi:hypothetical protein